MHTRLASPVFIHKYACFPYILPPTLTYINHESNVRSFSLFRLFICQLSLKRVFLFVPQNIIDIQVNFDENLYTAALIIIYYYFIVGVYYQYLLTLLKYIINRNYNPWAEFKAEDSFYCCPPSSYEILSDLSTDTIKKIQIHPF